LIGIVVIGQRIFNLGIETESVVVRIQFLIAAWKNLLLEPALGMGLGTAPLLSNTPVLPYALRFQPPHSFFLVILSETGVLGVCTFMLAVFGFFRTVWDRFRQKERLPLVLMTFFVLTGIGDHYWLTSVQGNLTIFLIGGMVLFSSTS
jgi:O-antigen ligase